MKQLLLEAFLPIIASLLSIFVPALLTLAFTRFQTWTGIEIEARQREALQSALINGARIIRGGSPTSAGIEYVLASVPDALKALKVDSKNRIAELLEPHVAAQTADFLRPATSSNPIRADPT